MCVQRFQFKLILESVSPATIYCCEFLSDLLQQLLLQQEQTRILLEPYINSKQGLSGNK